MPIAEGRIVAWITRSVLLSALALTLFLAGCAGGDYRVGAGPFSTVVVDAGHGGHDRGAKALSGLHEKSLALDTANRVAEILRAHGYRVILSRTSDVFVALGTRVAISNSARNSIFVSIHYNWARARSGSGVETYFHSPRSRRLAANIQREMLQAYPARNRGVKRRGYFVLRKNRRPAVLVECGFLSNPFDNAYVQQPASRQRIAEQIARGVLAERAGRRP